MMRTPPERRGCPALYSFDHACLELLQLLLVLGAHRLEQLTRRSRLLLVDDRDREPDVDQDPVAGPEIVEEPDVDGPSDPGNVDLGELVGLVDDLNDLAGNGQAHGRLLLGCYCREVFVSLRTGVGVTLPGLNRFSGSQADLIACMSLTAAAPCSSARNADLP